MSEKFSCESKMMNASAPPLPPLPPPYTLDKDAGAGESSTDSSPVDYISHIFTVVFLIPFWLQTMMYTFFEKRFVFVVDDSGSMATPVMIPQKNGNPLKTTRWEELKNSVLKAFDLSIGLSNSGIDIYFLNRNALIGVKDRQTIIDCFKNPPSGGTPLFKVLQSIHKTYDNLPGKTSITVWTDGTPDDESIAISVFDTFYPNKKRVNFGICIVLCTDDEKVVKTYGEYDELYPLEVYDDYHSQISAIDKVQNKHKVKIPINEGTYFALIFVAPWCDELDSLNEKCITRKQLNKIALHFAELNDKEHKYPRLESPSSPGLFRKMFSCF